MFWDVKCSEYLPTLQYICAMLCFSRFIKKKPGNLILGSSEAIIQRQRSTGALDDVTGKVSGQSSPLLSSPFRSPQFKSPDAGSDSVHSFKSTSASRCLV